MRGATNIFIESKCILELSLKHHLIWSFVSIILLERNEIVDVSQHKEEVVSCMNKSNFGWY